MGVSLAPGTFSSLAAVWTLLLPGYPERELLRSCLMQGEEALQSWHRFAIAVGDPKTWLQKNHSGLKALLPFLGERIALNELPAPADLRTWARMSTLREELRQAEVLRTCEELANRLVDDEALLLPGMSAAYSAWSNPDLRHNHALRLLVRDLPAATARLTDGGICTTHSANHAVWLRHPSGLAIELHARLHPVFGQEGDTQKSSAEALHVSGVALPLANRLDQLRFILARAASGDGNGNLRWIIDIHALLSRSTLTAAEAGRLARWLHIVNLGGFAGALDEYLRNDFQLTLGLAELELSKATGCAEERVLLYSALSSLQRRRAGVRKMKSLSEKSRYLVWLARERLSGRRFKNNTWPIGASAEIASTKYGL